MNRAEPAIDKKFDRTLQKCSLTWGRAIVPAKGFFYFGSGLAALLGGFNQNSKSAIWAGRIGSTEAGRSKKEKANSPCVGIYLDEQ
jgi:hypothetical protein